MVASNPLIGWVVDLAETARKGTWPLAGGVLDQLDVTYQAFRVVWSEESYCRAVLKLPPHG